MIQSGEANIQVEFKADRRELMIFFSSHSYSSVSRKHQHAWLWFFNNLVWIFSVCASNHNFLSRMVVAHNTNQLADLLIDSVAICDSVFYAYTREHWEKTLAYNKGGRPIKLTWNVDRLLQFKLRITQSLSSILPFSMLKVFGRANKWMDLMRSKSIRSTFVCT